MEIAHIIPPNVVKSVEPFLGRYHLLLPAYASAAEYRSFYQEADGLKILDNGVAEGSAVNVTHQMNLARVLRAKEIILPDVMGSMDATLDAVAQAFYEVFDHRQEFRFMLVAQGANVLDAISCVERTLNLMPGLIDSIGIPRHLLRLGMTTRLQIARAIRNISPRRAIHLLGTHPEHPDELYACANEYRKIGIRGCDTSLAWNAALQGVKLSTVMNEPKVIKRQPSDQFKEATLTDSKLLDLLQKNINILNKWVAA